jgi:hypothetical protein
MKDDFNAIIKLQLRHCPETLSEEEKRRYFNISRSEKVIRSIRDRLRELLQRIA